MLLVFLATIAFAAFADNINPPSGLQAIDPTKVSKTPPFDHPGLRRLANGDYEAYYVAEVFAFQPSTITVPDIMFSATPTPALPLMMTVACLFIPAQ